MKLPTSIEKGFIEQAVKSYFENGLPPDCYEDTTYKVIVEGKELPPPAIAKYAFYHKFNEWPEEFQGGLGSSCFKLLKSGGYKIITKSTINKDYLKFESLVFKHLMNRHEKDGLTFSVRQKASKKSELDYFIGTSTSNYSAFSLWNIPVKSFLAGDVISFIFIQTEPNVFTISFHFNINKNLESEQDNITIELGESIKAKLINQNIEFKDFNKTNKHFGFTSKLIDQPYNGLDSFLAGLDSYINTYQVLVNKCLKDIIEKHPTYIGSTYSKKDFDNLILKLEKRRNKYINLFDKSELQQLIADKEIIIDNYVNNKYSLNTILYGPPGTGKTYNTVLMAAEIIENREIQSYEEALKIFKTNLHYKIEFITFHQNYSYEDFIQGLRPETDNKSSLVFDKIDGVFKKIADDALENLNLSEKDSSELTNEAQFNIALEKFQEKFQDQDENLPINDTAYIFEVEKDAFRYTGEKWTNHTNGIRMKYTDLKEFYRNNVRSRKDVKKLTTISGLANQHATYFFLVYNQIIKLIPKKIEIPKKVRKENYVLIIDEINRANISRVFGELITLIEPDKRSHGAIPLEARLPSGDSFVVPSNLFIIGTMNTADKSIALLDIALRRRFEFQSMYPQYEIKDHEIYDVDILKKINEKVIKSKGHDFQIGHAYFMGENKDLIERMNKKVIPLLLEYYMNDEKEVKGILNSAGLKIEDNTWPLKISGKND